MTETNPKKRRPRYKGTHPKRAEEKYKELNPDKYTQDIETIRLAGRTPLGTHSPIMVSEVLKCLAIQNEARGLDATLGFGGHAREIIKSLGPNGKLIGIDRDPIELSRTIERLHSEGISPEQLFSFHSNYSEIPKALSAAKKNGFLNLNDQGLDFIFADLGLSSMQIDRPERGFSHKFAGPLDLRMNPNEGISATEYLKKLTSDQLAQLLIENADEPNARVLSLKVLESQKVSPIETTQNLVSAVRMAVSKLPRTARERDADKSIKRFFQALRIAVNQEFTHLDLFLEHVPNQLRQGGRVVILTFHSGEDRRVKKSFEKGLKSGVYSSVSDSPVRAGAEEIRKNLRAKPAKLRWAIRS